ncbi:MAG: hypothetical protein ACXWJZ_13320 [Burkholderiaceae bacterium]
MNKIPSINEAAQQHCVASSPSVASSATNPTTQDSGPSRSEQPIPNRSSSANVAALMSRQMSQNEKKEKVPSLAGSLAEFPREILEKIYAYLINSSDGQNPGDTQELALASKALYAAGQPILHGLQVSHLTNNLPSMASSQCAGHLATIQIALTSDQMWFALRPAVLKALVDVLYDLPLELQANTKDFILETVNKHMSPTGRFDVVAHCGATLMNAPRSERAAIFNMVKTHIDDIMTHSPSSLAPMLKTMTEALHHMPPDIRDDVTSFISKSAMNCGEEDGAAIRRLLELKLAPLNLAQIDAYFQDCSAINALQGQAKVHALISMLHLHLINDLPENYRRDAGIEILRHTADMDSADCADVLQACWNIIAYPPAPDRTAFAKKLLARTEKLDSADCAKVLPACLYNLVRLPAPDRTAFAEKLLARTEKLDYADCAKVLPACWNNLVRLSVPDRTAFAEKLQALA